MSKPNFFFKLAKQEKLSLVEPSENISNSYIEKSQSNLISAKILIEHDRLEESVSMSYYSMYHMLTSLFFKCGIKCENHSASIILLKKLFDIDNSKISFSKSERIDKQYYTDFSITKKEVEEGIVIAEEFNSEIFDFISKLSNEKIKLVREKFMLIIN